jgi:quercetin dioxygenase-like cupin family protein
MNDAAGNASMTLREPEIDGSIETEAQGLAYGAMVFAVKPGCSSPPHRHASEETWIVLEGDGWVEVDGRSIGLFPGARFTVPPGALHWITNTSTTDLRVISFWWRQVNRDG